MAMTGPLLVVTYEPTVPIETPDNSLSAIPTMSTLLGMAEGAMSRQSLPAIPPFAPQSTRAALE